MTIKRYIIEVDQPDDVSITRMKEYIKAATDLWGGQFHPDDPLFTGNWNNDVKVASATPKKIKRLSERLKP